MALTRAQKNKNRKDRASGKEPRHKSAAFTAADSATVDGTYGSQEQGVIGNNRTRLAETVTALQDADILA